MLIEFCRFKVSCHERGQYDRIVDHASLNALLSRYHRDIEVGSADEIAALNLDQGYAGANGPVVAQLLLHRVAVRLTQLSERIDQVVAVDVIGVGVDCFIGILLDCCLRPIYFPIFLIVDIPLIFRQLVV